MRAARRVAVLVALSAACLPAFGQVDQLSVVVDCRPLIGSKRLASFGYDPSRNAVFLTALGTDYSVPGNPAFMKVSNVDTSMSAEVLLSTSDLDDYYSDGNWNLVIRPAEQGGLLLNPKPLGAIPAFGMAMIADGTRIQTVSGSTLPFTSKRLYGYNVQQTPGVGGPFTTRLTLGDMQSAAGGTATSSFMHRQFAWSGDGQSIYFNDSSAAFGGLWKLGALSGSPQRLMAEDDTSSEPAVRTTGGIDQIFLSGGGSTGNVGGIDFVAHNGTTTSARQVAVSAATLSDFFEVTGTMPSQKVSSLTAVGDDLYFVFYTNASSTKPESRYTGVYRYDAEGRLSKVVNKTQRAAALGGVNLVLDRLQSRTIAVTGTSGTFNSTQLLYREGGVNTVAGATAFKPVDFNRDNQVTAADLTLFVPQVTIRGQVKTNVADLTFDMNGNDTVDWKDVQIVEGFLGYVADPALAGRIVPSLPIQADADLNGVVDFNDFLVMQANYDTTSQGFTQGDYNGDNQVSFADLQPWINSYGSRSAVVGAGVPMAPFNTAVWNQFLAGIAPPPVTLDVAAGQQTQFQAGYRTIVIASSVTKTGTGTLVYDAANTYTGDTVVSAGGLQFADPGAVASSTLRVAAGAKATVAPGITATAAGLDLSAGGLVDVTTGGMTVTAGLSAMQLVARILEGRGASGDWTGTSGITSSAAAAAVAQSIPRAIGWLDNGDGSVSFGFAAPGDTNIDGTVDILDAANFLAGGKFDSSEPASWNEGDFGYDGVVDILDAADFLSTGLFDAGPYIPSAAGVAPGVAAVPEPALSVVAVAAAVALACRRRRQAATVA
jgi:autotransporter-associated beta strand protein